MVVLGTIEVQKLNRQDEFGRFYNIEATDKLDGRIDFFGVQMMSEYEIIQWMRNKIKESGFTNATALAESFLKAHHINDALDPVFSRSLDAGFKLAQEIRDRQLVVAG